MDWGHELVQFFLEGEVLAGPRFMTRIAFQICSDFVKVIIAVTGHENS